ncbi:MAG TPA: ATP-binding protein [Acidimicrobiales bacterium]|nr:ATP-binding protein [Acidimicrobiales bacterium]
MRYLPRSHGKVVYERRVLRTPTALHTVRHQVAEQLEREGATAETIKDVLIVLSELGTNAMHATGYGDEIEVRVAIEPNDDIDVEVEDPGTGFRLSEGLRFADQDDEHGRGLAIVCLLADETTVSRRRRHTVVRARISARRSA